MIGSEGRSRRGPQMSATPDSTLDNREQLIANLQRQLAESRAERDEAQRQLDERTIERDEALAQRTATSEVLQVINSSPGDLAPVFDTMLEKATRLCEADFGILLTHKENQYRAAGFHNVPPAYQELLRDPIRPGAKTALARVAGGEPVAQIVDIAADEELLSEPMVHGALQIAGFRTMLAVPLRQEGTFLVPSRSTVRRCARSPTSKSRCCRTSRRMRSSRWRTRGS